MIHKQDPRTVRWGIPPPLRLRRDPLREQALRSALGSEVLVLYRAEDEMSVLCSVDGGYMHMSIALPHRYPTWDEILSVRKWAFPDDMECVLVLARASEYVNVHKNCFHVWESRCGQEGR